MKRGCCHRDSVSEYQLHLVGRTFLSASGRVPAARTARIHRPPSTVPDGGQECPPHRSPHTIRIEHYSFNRTPFRAAIAAITDSTSAIPSDRITPIASV